VVERPGRGADHAPLPSAEVKRRLDLYLYSHLGLRGLYFRHCIPCHVVYLQQTVQCMRFDYLGLGGTR